MVKARLEPALRAALVAGQLSKPVHGMRVSVRGRGPGGPMENTGLVG